MVGHDAQEPKYYDDLAAAGGARSPPLSRRRRGWSGVDHAPLCIVGSSLRPQPVPRRSVLRHPALRTDGFATFPDKQQKIEANFAKNGILILLSGPADARHPVAGVHHGRCVPDAGVAVPPRTRRTPSPHQHPVLARVRVHRPVRRGDPGRGPAPAEAIAVVLAAVSGAGFTRYLVKPRDRRPADIPTIVKPAVGDARRRADDREGRREDSRCGQGGVDK